MINNIKLKAEELGFKPKNDINFISKFRSWVFGNYDIQILPIYSYRIKKYSIVIFYNSNNLTKIKGFYDTKESALLKGLYEVCLYLNTKNVA